jgi:chromosome segregation ATPase
VRSGEKYYWAANFRCNILNSALEEMIQMGDSQSRYSIVERLAFKKLELLDDKAKYDREVQELEQEIENRTKGIAVLKTTSAENLKRDINGREREISNLKMKIAYKKKKQASYEKLIDSKISEVDKAMKALEKISETAPSAAENK